jgi:hypothetical protein
MHLAWTNDVIKLNLDSAVNDRDKVLAVVA